MLSSVFQANLTHFAEECLGFTKPISSSSDLHILEIEQLKSIQTAPYTVLTRQTETERKSLKVNRFCFALSLENS